MKIAILYGTTHGRTKKIVKKLPDFLNFKYDVFNVKEIDSNKFLLDYDLFFFISPTYGDEELQDDIENFLQKLKDDLTSKEYIIMETGNYYGYDDFEFGAKKIIEYHLQGLNAKEYYCSLSLDTLPKIDWDLLAEWSNGLNKRICQ